MANYKIIYMAGFLCLSQVSPAAAFGAFVGLGIFAYFEGKS